MATGEVARRCRASVGCGRMEREPAEAVRRSRLYTGGSVIEDIDLPCHAHRARLLATVAARFDGDQRSNRRNLLSVTRLNPGENKAIDQKREAHSAKARMHYAGVLSGFPTLGVIRRVGAIDDTHVSAIAAAADK